MSKTRTLRRNGLAMAIGQCLAMGVTGMAHSADIFVADGAVDVVDDGQCSINEAVINANNDDQSGSVDCIAGNGNDDILLPFDSVFTFTEPDPGSGRALPLIDSNITFEGNNATLTRDSAAPAFGLVQVDNYARFNTMTLSNGTVDAGGGGCLYVNSGTLRLRNTTVTGCSASTNGGGIYAINSTLRMYNSSIVSGNVAGGSGGGIYTNGGSARLSGGRIENNSATNGGGVFSVGGQMRVYGAVANNTATLLGGGIYANTVSLTVRNRGLYDNNAADGGGGIFARGGSANIQNLTVRNNSTDADGGGIRLEQTTASLSQALIQNNSGQDGAGVFAAETSLSVSESTISGNTANRTGGGLRVLASSLNVQQTRVSDNNAQAGGGGIFAEDGTFTLGNSTVASNTADGSGGGVLVVGNMASVSATVSQSTFTNNVAGVDGGAIQLSYDVGASVSNSTFGYNTARENGGAIHNRQAALTAEHVTLSGNAAASAGENLWIDATGGPVSLRNSIVAAGSNNTVRDCVVIAGSLTENLNNLSEDGTCDDNASGLIEDDPLLETLGRNGGALTFALMDGSPAIDVADETTCLGEDQRGVARASDMCDIGAFELTAPILVDEVSSGVGAMAITGVDGLCSLPEAILNSNDGGQLFADADECEPGIEGASDRIVLPATATFTIVDPNLATPQNGLPRVASRTTIVGNRATIQRESDREFRHIENYGELTISDVTMTGGASPRNLGGPLAKAEGSVAGDVRKGFRGRTGSGGAILNNGNLSLDRVTLSGNSAYFSGGALFSSSYYRYSSGLTITNSTLSGNTASRGGGIQISGDATLLNSTLSGNTAIDNGGSILNETDPDSTTNGGGSYLQGVGGAINSSYRGTLTITNSTLAFNTADTASGLYVGNTLDMSNSMIVDGTDSNTSDCTLRTPPPTYYYSNPGVINVNVNNLVEDGSCSATFSGSGQALLDPLADNGGPTQTHALVLTNNPAVDGGDASTCAQFAYDQRGAPFPRSVDSDNNGSVICDIGAFESDGMPSDIIFSDGFE